MEASGLNVWAVVVAGGSGRRMGADVAKQYLELGGEPLMVHAVRSIAGIAGPHEKDADDESSPLRFMGAVLVVPTDDIEKTEQQVLSRLEGVRVVGVVGGGEERSESVRNGLVALLEAEASNDDIVFIHDGVRPFAPVEKLAELARKAAPDGAIIAAPCIDTIKRVAGDEVTGTVDRSTLALAQTPQAFPLGRIFEAHEEVARRNIQVTDDASVIEALGGKVKIVQGSSRNMKITTPDDLAVARALISQGGAGQHADERVFERMRVGHGYDAHKLVEGRKLILGGVEVQYEKGLLGHSDADVLAHAVADAVLGGAGLGDIGRHFPDTDPAFKDADSIKLLEAVAEETRKSGYRVLNVDATLMAQAPKVAPHIAAMSANIARALKLATEAVNVKATTTEGMGFVGQGEGMATHAVVMLSAL